MPHDELTELQDRIARARAARADSEADLARRAEIARLTKIAEAEERDTADAPHIAAAVQQHGEDRTAVVATDLGSVVVKRPHHLQWNRLASKGEKMTTTDVEQLVKSCVVWPEWPRVSSLLEELPGAMGVIVDAITTLARGGATVRAGK